MSRQCQLADFGRSEKAKSSHLVTIIHPFAFRKVIPTSSFQLAPPQAGEAEEPLYSAWALVQDRAT